MWGIYRILNLRSYPGTLNMTGHNLLSTHQDLSVPSEKFNIPNSFKVLNIFNVPFATKGNKFASQSRINDGFNDIIMQTNDKSKAQLISYFLAQDEGDYF